MNFMYIVVRSPMRLNLNMDLILFLIESISFLKDIIYVTIIPLLLRISVMKLFNKLKLL